jgi:hypothetical protein
VTPGLRTLPAATCWRRSQRSGEGEWAGAAERGQTAARGLLPVCQQQQAMRTRLAAPVPAAATGRTWPFERRSCGCGVGPRVGGMVGMGTPLEDGQEGEGATVHSFTVSSARTLPHYSSLLVALPPWAAAAWRELWGAGSPRRQLPASASASFSAAHHAVPAGVRRDGGLASEAEVAQGRAGGTSCRKCTSPRSHAHTSTRPPAPGTSTHSDRDSEAPSRNG